MILLSTSFPALEMRPGISFGFEFTALPGFRTTQRAADISWFFDLLQVLVVVLLILLPVYFALSLLTGEGRRKLLVNTILITIFLLGALWLTTLDLPPAPQQGSESIPESVDDAIPSPAFMAEPASWMLPIAIIATAALLTVGVLLAKLYLTQQISPESLQYSEIDDSAKNAIVEIGEPFISFDDVIIRCYVEMSRLLQAQEGLQRSRAMTTYEFEQALIARGFPSRPIRQLTRLFEKVRYGRHHAVERDERIAVECLSEIIDYCRGQT